MKRPPVRLLARLAPVWHTRQLRRTTQPAPPGQWVFCFCVSKFVTTFGNLFSSLLLWVHDSISIVACFTPGSLLSRVVGWACMVQNFKPDSQLCRPAIAYPGVARRRRRRFGAETLCAAQKDNKVGGQGCRWHRTFGPYGPEADAPARRQRPSGLGDAAMSADDSIQIDDDHHSGERTKEGVRVLSPVCALGAGRDRNKRSHGLPRDASRRHYLRMVGDAECHQRGANGFETPARGRQIHIASSIHA